VRRAWPSAPRAGPGRISRRKAEAEVGYEGGEGRGAGTVGLSTGSRPRDRIAAACSRSSAAAWLGRAASRAAGTRAGLELARVGTSGVAAAAGTALDGAEAGAPSSADTPLGRATANACSALSSNAEVSMAVIAELGTRRAISAVVRCPNGEAGDADDQRPRPHLGDCPCCRDQALSGAGSGRSAAADWPAPASRCRPAAGSACGSARRFPWRSRCRGCASGWPRGSRRPSAGS
jgi:hypothetical protein